MRKACLAVVLIMGYMAANAQIKIDKMLKYEQPVHPEMLDNYHYSVFYSGDKSAYNLKGIEIASPGGKIHTIKVNPAGHSYALLSGKIGKTKVTVYPTNSSSGKNEIKNLNSPTAICYTPDSRQLLVADFDQIKIFDSKTLQPQNVFYIDGRPMDLKVSPNGYYLAVIYPSKIDVYNLTAFSLRKSIPASSGSVAFSPSSDKIGVLVPSGKLTMYSTSDFSPVMEFDNLGSNCSNLFYHPDENYVGYLADGGRIQFVNLFNSSDRPSIQESGTTSVRLVNDDRQNLYLVNVSGNNLRYRMISGLSENFSLMVSQRVDDLLAEWTKMRPGETDVEYRQRVNEESIKKQRELFARQEASRMALTAGLGEFGVVTLGQYNPADGTLIVSLGNNLPDIFLKVPVDDMAGFGDGNNLQFSNHVFTVTPANTFELIYVEVFNPTNGKTYIFDNLEGQNLDFLNTNDGFVSLDLIMKSSREDVVLKDIKDQIMNDARTAKRLSDHTILNVDTRIESAVDPSGRRIQNYLVDFGYEVDAEGSATEDFSPGKYNVIDSHAAESMLQIIRQAFQSEFADYIVPGKKLIVHITGSADALPVNRIIPYDGSLGEFIDEPCEVNGALTSLSVGKSRGIRTNEELGFMRAKAVEKKMRELLPQLENMSVDYRYNINVAKEKGAEFRRIKVSLEFIDAF